MIYTIKIYKICSNVYIFTTYPHYMLRFVKTQISKIIFICININLNIVGIQNNIK